jgi:uncharacterized protein YfaT (DUF1175 family)
MMTIEQAEVGREVVYSTSCGSKTEHGVITSANHRWVFVRYDGSWQPQATDPYTLTLLSVGSHE